MSSVKLSASSIDEINFIYKKIKREFTPQDSIKLNQQSMEYELVLKRNELDMSLKSICDKVIDMDDLLDEDSIFEDFSWKTFSDMMKGEQQKKALRALYVVWNNLSSEKQRACFTYFCEEKELDPESLLAEEVDSLS